MDREDDEIRFAFGVLDDHRRLIAAGKTHRWDIVKWAVTVNLALAAASATLKNQSANATELFWWLALSVAILSGFLMLEITRRMTAARDDSLAPLNFLSDRGINVVKVTGKASPKEHELSYDKQEALIYLVILFASAAPAFFVWRLS